MIYVRCVVYVVFFFFKQKTAYEMRISDWSSDVCSSDLLDPGKQDATGVGVNVGYGIDAFAIDLGVTPLGFNIVNPVGGISWAPTLDQNVGLKFTLEQRAVTDSVLSYAGAEDARTEDLTWGDRKSTRLNSSH